MPFIEGFQRNLPNLVGKSEETGLEVAIPRGKYFIHTVCRYSVVIETPLGLIRISK